MFVVVGIYLIHQSYTPVQHLGEYLNTDVDGVARLPFWHLKADTRFSIYGA